jgi:hypothetical protein
VTKPETGQTWKVEIKTARFSHCASRENQGWNFCMRKAGHTDCMDADFVLLQAVRASGDVVTFLIPAHALKGIVKIVMKAKSPLEYRGKWSRWRCPYTDIDLQANDLMLNH